MYQAMSFYLYFIILLTLTLFASWIKTFIPRQRTHKTMAHVRNLLNPQAPLESLLLARAAPNQRLVHAFGLTNTFVSGDIQVHRTFTASAKALIAAGSTGEKEAAWRAVASSAEATVRQFLPDHDNVIAFSTFVQCITFAVVLTTLFGTDLDTIQYEDVMYVTQTINRLWEASKTKDAAALHRDDNSDSSYSLRKMNALIEQWVIDLERFQNPLNFILPAYETMWRVVGVTVAYVYRHPDNSLFDTAITFSRETTENSFEGFWGEDGDAPSMQALVLEVLRLHPPTKHIARATTAKSSSAGSWFSRWRNAFVPEIEIADIEAVHLSKTEYGEDADVFNPMRFHPSRREGRGLDLYAFGFGRLRCIATAWAPMVAGIITAKVIEQLDETNRTVTVGNKIGGRIGWEGWTVTRRVEKGASE